MWAVVRAIIGRGAVFDVVLFGFFWPLSSNNWAGISKKYCETNSGSPEVELRYSPLSYFILFKY